MNKRLLIQLKSIKMLFLDFDGVMTDGYVYIDENGKETVRCSRRDGLGLALLKKAGIKLGVISKEKNPVTRKRCRKLGISCWQGIKDGVGKLEVLRKVIKGHNIDIREVCYIGDDLNDIAVLSDVGVAIAVADAHKKVKEKAHFVTLRKGGDHAVREVCEMILQSKK